MKINLNDNQKQFLFDEYYVTSKVLDAYTYSGWQNFYIKNFIWKLDTNYNRWNMRTLVLVNKGTGEEDFNINLNFQGHDFAVLMKL